jgi:GAF domain-containing protein
MLRGEFVHIPDRDALSRTPENERPIAILERRGTPTHLMVPLWKDGTLHGFISAARTERRAFSEREIASLRSFAAQAVIAMENARLLTETREALDQQTATADVLQVINASAGDVLTLLNGCPWSHSRNHRHIGG